MAKVLGVTQAKMEYKVRADVRDAKGVRTRLGLECQCGSQRYKLRLILVSNQEITFDEFVAYLAAAGEPILAHSVIERRHA